MVLSTSYLLLAAVSDGYELRPGAIRNPAGLQASMRAVYNPAEDNYLLLYEDGRALVGHLSPAGAFSGEAVLSGNLGISHVNAAFNPEDRTFLVVYRVASPAELYGRYLTANGMPIGNAFYIGAGGAPSLDYSTKSGRYVVTWAQLSAGVVRFRAIHGDATSSPAPASAIQTVGQGQSDGVAYGSVADKSLVVYVRDVGGAAKANVYGRFIASNGSSIGPEFAIAAGAGNQQVPRVGYASSTNRWMVVYENWADCAKGCPNIRGTLVSSTGGVVKNFNVAATAAWDLPGPVEYNSSTDTFLTGWRSAYSDTNIDVRAGEFSPADGSLVRPSVQLTNQNAAVEGLAVRPDAADPQAMFLWRVGYGLNGLHAGIVHLKGGGGGPPGPDPDTTPPARVTDLRGAAVAGGTPVAATAIASTNAGPSNQDMTKTTDGKPATFWSSPDRNAVTPEFITWDLGSLKTVGAVRLLSRAILFPLDYQIQVSTDNLSFTTAFSVTGASVSAGSWVEHSLPGVRARYLKLLVTRARRTETGKFKAQIAEAAFLEASSAASINLQWTAPGDDGTTGKAAAYDLRWSPSAITSANFASARAIDAPAPSPARTRESVTVSGLPADSVVYFALKTRDEVPNVSELSNVISVGTGGVPPAAVQGLTASNPTGTTVDLSWKPSGEDGNTGNATSYDIRHSTSAITDANFGSATSVLRPATKPKPATERFTIRDLASGTTYYFAIKAIDKGGSASLINGNLPVTATTLNLQPGAIADLGVGGRAVTELHGTAVAASGQNSANTSREKATDGNPLTYWSSPGRGASQPEFITLDLGEVRNIGRVTLLSRGAGALFPLDVEIQVSTDNTSFTTVDRRTDLPATRSMMHLFELRPVNARYVRIQATRTRVSAGGVHYVQIAEIDVWEPITSFHLTLSWTEPGVRGTPGKASSFDVRYATSPIANDAQFAAAAQLEGEPAPRGAGMPASFRFEPREEGITLYFRMKYVDKDGKLSALSNEASGLVAIVAPAAVRDLSASDAGSTSVDLSWTTTGDDERTGTATSFDVRYASCPLDDANFGSATDAGIRIPPAVAGTRQRATVSGLEAGTTYCFAMKVVDDAGAVSEISNVVRATTDPPDTTPPSDVDDLRGSAPFELTRIPATAIASSSAPTSSTGFAKATDGNPLTHWASAGSPRPTEQWITLDVGSSRRISHVGLLSRNVGALFPEEVQVQVSEDDSSYTTVLTASGLPSTRALEHDLVFPAIDARYVRILATKPRATEVGEYYVQIAEIEVNEARPVEGPVSLRWTAPGDDGSNGTAASYDLRYSRNPITGDASFAAATPVQGEPVPQEAGAAETMEVNLGRGTYYFALRAKDEAGNASGISNVPAIVVP
jgi:hypothetical protein